MQAVHVLGEAQGGGALLQMASLDNGRGAEGYAPLKTLGPQLQAVQVLGEVHGAGAQLHHAAQHNAAGRRRQQVRLPPQRRLLWVQMTGVKSSFQADR